MAVQSSNRPPAANPDDLIMGYEAAHASSGYLLQPDAGLLRIEGEDRIAFMQRQTTNDLTRLVEGRVLSTVLTSPAARILDVLQVITENGALLAATLPGRGSQTVQFLQSKIFFMDKVRVVSKSRDFLQILLIGPDASQTLNRLGFKRPPGLDEAAAVSFENVSMRAWGERAPGGLGFRLIAPVELHDALLSALVEAAAAPLSPEAFETLRVEAGFPGPRVELTEEYTPLETGLRHAISDNKGCYTGQEVIARQITYDKVTRLLVGLRCSEAVRVGDRVWADGRPAGQVTSAARSPRFGMIALGVIKRPYHEPGTDVWIGPREGGIAARTTDLPFKPLDQPA